MLSGTICVCCRIHFTTFEYFLQMYILSLLVAAQETYIVSKTE